jgi:hypothetical protein
MWSVNDGLGMCLLTLSSVFVDGDKKIKINKRKHNLPGLKDNFILTSASLQSARRYLVFLE